MDHQATEEAVAFLRTNSEMLEGKTGFGWLAERLRGIADQVDDLLRENIRLSEQLDQHVGVLEVGGVRMDLSAQQAYFRGEPLTLTRIEYRLLHALARTPDAAVSVPALVETIWGEKAERNIPSLRVHMSHLRAKIDDGANGHRAIATIPGVGYLLSTDT